MERNPLDCISCKEDLSSPIFLRCLHTVCNPCEANHSSTCCILQGSSREEDDVLCSEDKLAVFLLKSSQERTDNCANCERMVHPMFYCETCQQYLCSPCKLSTHNAKMFQRHIIMKSEERSFVQSNSFCEKHNEPFVLYNEEEHSLACIKCFNDVQPEQKVFFVSLDQAYKNILSIIEVQSVSLKSHQDFLLQELDTRRKALTEASRTYSQEKESLDILCDSIIDAVNDTRSILSERLEREKAEAESSCEIQIENIQSYIFPTKLCLMATRLLFSSASQIDSLQLLPLLIKRTQMICSQNIKRVPPPKTCQSLQFRTELAKVLEPHIGLSAAWCPISAVREGTKESNGSSGSCITVSGSQNISKPNVLPKFQAMIDLSGAFGQLFNRVEGPLKDVAIELSKLSIRAQEMQRDITKRRCLLKPELINILIKECQNLETTLGLHSQLIEELQPEMQELWQEQLDRVRRQQIIFREKVNDCMSLRCIVRDVLNAAKQLRPFAVCIEQMSSLIDPRRCHPPDPAPMESICLQISTIEPNSECRIAAIEKEEQNRRTVLEAKKKAEAADRELVRKGLKHGKHRKKDQFRVMVNTNRERSPGGTDSTLFSPFMRKLNCSYRDVSDETSVFADQVFNFYSKDDTSGIDLAICDQARCSSSLSLTLPSCDSSPNQQSDHGFKAEHCYAHDDRDCHSYMLQSLHDVFALQKSDSDPNDKNVLASVVKISQKKKKTLSHRSSDAEESFTEVLGRTQSSGSSAKDVKRSKKGRSSAEAINEPTAELTELDLDRCDIPKVPHYMTSSALKVEDKILEGFEAKEKILKSLKEKAETKNNSGQ
ncbi:unnamed protein product [Auanema sp. JU1783]|nr:unnamed protein product [Auanema sp. JU1783]